MFLEIIIIFIFIYSIYAYIDGDNIILVLFKDIYLRNKNINVLDLYCRNNDKKTDIIVSLTTTPERIDKIETTLKSILDQSRSPKEIRLNIPDFSLREKKEYIIPEYIKKLSSVKIIRCADYGPATKLIPSIKSLNNDQNILVIDDDRLYPRWLVDKLHKLLLKQNDYVIALSGWIVPDDLTDKPTTWWSSITFKPPAPIKSNRLLKKRKVDIIQGYAGYVVKPCFFNIDQICDYSKAPDTAFYVDDIWISAHCHVPKFVYPGMRVCGQSLFDSAFYKESSLGLLNRGNGDNKKRSNSVMIQYFKDRWLTKQSVL